MIRWPKRAPRLRRTVALVLMGAATAASAQQPATAPSVTVREAWARPCLAGTPCGVYVTLANAASTAVDIVAVTSPLARTVEMHETMLHDGQAHMMAHPTATIPARGVLDGRPGKWHLMLGGVKRGLVVGDSIALTFIVRHRDRAQRRERIAAVAIVRAP
jgi:periplasmic copper chaperone A